METADEILYKGLLEIGYIADKRENSDGTLGMHNKKGRQRKCEKTNMKYVIKKG